MHPDWMTPLPRHLAPRSPPLSPGSPSAGISPVTGTITLLPYYLPQTRKANSITEIPKAREQLSVAGNIALVCMTQGSRCLLEICINRRETLCILRQWYEKCVQYNLELMHVTKPK